MTAASGLRRPEKGGALELNLNQTETDDAQRIPPAQRHQLTAGTTEVEFLNYLPVFQLAGEKINKKRSNSRGDVLWRNNGFILRLEFQRLASRIRSNEQWLRLCFAMLRLSGSLSTSPIGAGPALYGGEGPQRSVGERGPSAPAVAPAVVPSHPQLDSRPLSSAPVISILIAV
ncbi:hypothetical protein SKAU_G00327850 [Synaphobranchus kaupii]|uniref:Uncharacterized protein n=1 Tax=Synaphobranchus kaupii TaxID=118154 RepID=A0A9Q1IK81_SYNKA|nr:hypothetical protein SKAU_G00327850 [Synaphobranchus kaupii]